MKKILIVWFAAVLAFVSCMENPLSYPLKVAEITSFEVSGQKSVSIDPSSMTVTVVLEETADIKSLNVLEYAYTENSEPSVVIPQTIDLSQPIKVTYQTYPDQKYEWTIKAEQPIERYIKCDGMIGDAEFDTEKKSALIYFPEGHDLSKLHFTKIKLEALGSKIDSTFGFVSVNGQQVATEDKLLLPMTLDCVISRTFRVLYRDKKINWTVTAVHKQVDLEISSVNAWCHRAEFSGTFKGGGKPVIEYSESGTQQWISLETKTSGTVATAAVDQLSAATAYVARIVNGDDISEEFAFNTEEPVQLPNMSFDDWHQGAPGGYTWYPYAEGGDAVWGCSNSGVNMMSAVNSTRPEASFICTPDRGNAVRLESVKVFGMFAAGNIFTGKFVKATISGGVGAELDWGTPFTNRPYSLRGFYSYAPKVVDNAADGYQHLLGKNDTAQIMVILTDWDEPFRIITASETFVDIDNDPHIIGLGKLETDQDTGGKYKEFECVIDYRDTTRKPKYVVAVACSSKYGDYFTGGQGSVMYVDNWEFVYR